MASNKEALKKYGRHLENCLGGLSNAKRDCTCGLDAALADQPSTEAAPDEWRTKVWNCANNLGEMASGMPTQRLADAVTEESNNLFSLCIETMPQEYFDLSQEIGANNWSTTASKPAEQEPSAPCVEIGCGTTTGNHHVTCPEFASTNTASKAPIDDQTAFGAWYSDIAPDERTVDNYHMAKAAWQAAMQLRQVPQWLPIESAPKDGTYVLLWVRHKNADYVPDAIKEGWAVAVMANWIDHNGGGFSWQGLCGKPTHWMPLPAAPLPAQDDK